MRNGEPNMYAGICASRNTTIQIQWSGMQAFLAFNAVALPIAFGSLQPEIVKGLISIAGFFMHMGLSLATAYAVNLLSFYDQRLADLENQDQDDSGLGSRVAIFSHPDFWRHQEWPRLQAYFIPYGFGMLIWGYATFVHFHPLR